MKMEYIYTEKITKPIINEVLDIEKKEGLTPENLLERAKDKNNPLFSLFEWDNKSAGESWRLQQARGLINEIKVKIDTQNFYAFENLSVSIGEDSTERQYISAGRILSNKEMRSQIVENAKKSIIYWFEKYSVYGGGSELKPIFISISKLKKKWEKKK